jgi:DNA-binding XRE family transcriptional regulator
MSKNWLWDRKLNVSEARKILKNPEHKDFISLAALLLARNNEPQVVFREYLEPLIFCKRWAEIKKRMSKDKWQSQRIVFWQTIFEKLKEKYKKQGIPLREKRTEFKDDICREIGQKLREIRQEKGLSQKALAGRLGVSQQLISRIENGKENISLIILKNIVNALDKKVKIELSD